MCTQHEAVARYAQLPRCALALCQVSAPLLHSPYPLSRFLTPGPLVLQTTGNLLDLVSLHRQGYAANKKVQGM